MTISSQRNANDIYTPGLVIGVRVGLFIHKGIVTGNWIAGEPAVISNSFKLRGVYEERLSEFAGNRDVQIIGYPGSLPWQVVVTNARSNLGRRYDAIFYNCDHFVTESRGLTPRSAQLAGLLSVVVVAIGVWHLSR